jgi:hypothetical protein
MLLHLVNLVLIVLIAVAVAACFIMRATNRVCSKNEQCRICDI